MLCGWMGDRMFYSQLPPAGNGHGFFLQKLGGDAPRAPKAAVVVDTALSAFDLLRRGSIATARSLFDARLNEGRRRHKEVRPIPVTR